MDQMSDVVRDLQVPARRLARRKTAVAAATMRALKPRNHYRRDWPVVGRVCASQTARAVPSTDAGGSATNAGADVPEREAKLADLQSPRRGGLVLI
jgi:hypothetical protein